LFKLATRSSVSMSSTNTRPQHCRCHENDGPRQVRSHSPPLPESNRRVLHRRTLRTVCRRHTPLDVTGGKEAVREPAY
jgi:hypothetical protein